MNPIPIVWAGMVLDQQRWQKPCPWATCPTSRGTLAGRDVLQYRRIASSPAGRESVPNRVALGEFEP